MPPETSDLPWSWSSTGERGIYWLKRAGVFVGSVSLIPGHIEHEAVLLDEIVDLINQRHA